MNLLYTELIKLKNTAALWLTLSGALFVPVVLFSTYLSDVAAFVPAKGTDPWDDFLIRTLNGCCFFSVGFILLIIGLIVHIEHKANAWKHLFTLPLNKGRIYWSKLTLIFGTIVVFFTLYLVFSVVSGITLGHLEPTLGFSTFDFPSLHLVGFLLAFSISLLPMIFLQYWLSVRLKSLITSLGIGLGGLMIGLLMKNWDNIMYLPYATPFQLLNYKETEAASYQNFYLLNAVYSVILVALSYRDFTKRSVG